MVDVGAVAEITGAGISVARVGDHSVAIVADGQTIFAVDNRCPHMGFPLHKGTVRNGILTCHWHEARFELSSGCTFDLWADDAVTFAVEVRDGRVRVESTPRHDHGQEYQLGRLRQGMGHQVGLVQAKSLFTLLEGRKSRSADLTAVMASIVAFTVTNTDQFGEGMVRLTCVARMLSVLKEDSRYLGLCYAVRQLAAEANAGPPRRPRGALTDSRVDADTLGGWLDQWVRTRHRDAAERTLLTAAGDAAGSAEVDGELATMLFAAAGIRRYADGGHLLDACNKALEMVDVVGPASRAQLMPLLAGRLASARGAEESTSWHHPREIVDLVESAHERLAAILPQPKEAQRPLQDDSDEEQNLVTALLGADAAASIQAIETTLGDGFSPADVADAVSYAAGMRLARFAPSNEVGDWFNPQHTFIFSNAVAQAVRRSAHPDVVRSVYDAAVSVYLDRYLNVPPVPLPAFDGADGAAAVSGEGRVRDDLLSVFDERSDGQRAAAYVAALFGKPDASWPPAARVAELTDALALATLREDLDFHSVQVLEAAATQTEARERARGDRSAAAASNRTISLFIGVVRNLAAHCPTQRAGQQTALIARRLQRGEHIYEQ